MPIQLPRHRFTVQDYHQMDGTIFYEDDRVELIRGEILDMPPIGGPHISAVNRLNQAFVVGLLGRAMTQVQNPIRLDDYSEPQPDLSLVQPDLSEYPALARDVFLVVWRCPTRHCVTTGA